MNCCVKQTKSMDTNFEIYNLGARLVIDEFHIDLPSFSIVSIDFRPLENKVWAVNGIICHLHPDDFELLFEKLGEKDVDYLEYFHKEAKRTAIGIKHMPFLFLNGFPKPDEDLTSGSQDDSNESSGTQGL